jgi:hypothetical protein
MEEVLYRSTVIFSEITHKEHKAIVNESGSLRVCLGFLCGLCHFELFAYRLCFFVVNCFCYGCGWPFLICWNVGYWVTFIYLRAQISINIFNRKVCVRCD